MKKFILPLLLIICTGAFATIRTVSNNPSTLAQFNTINAAIAASSNGDTVLVHGSPNQYGGFTLSGKRLTIIGPGWAPNKNAPFTALVQQSSIFSTEASNSEIQGLVFVGSVDCYNTPHADNLRFIRNQFYHIRVHIHQGSTTYTGYLFEGNYFDNAQVYAETNSTYTNFLFQNNWFTETGCCFNGNLRGFLNTVSVLFNHNMFSSSNNINNVVESQCRFLMFTNNIFVNRDALSNITNSTFTNNLTFGGTNTSPWTGNSNVDGGGNIANTDPQLTTSVTSGAPPAISDFTINAGPANNAGSDGKDMGLLYDATGSLNWANSRTSRLPYIFSMNITNPTINSGGSLNVIVEARKSN